MKPDLGVYIGIFMSLCFPVLILDIGMPWEFTPRKTFLQLTHAGCCFAAGFKTRYCSNSSPILTPNVV